MKRIVLGFFLSMSLANVSAYQSGIDAGGYRYIDSAEAEVSYDFDDISTNPDSGVISLGDDQSKIISIGFTYKFYGVDYTQLYVSSNGFISFTSSNQGCCTGYVIPSSTAFSRLGVGIAAWWEDLNPGSGGTVHYLLSGTAPERVLTIQFKNVPAYSNSGRNTFQYKLYEGKEVAEVHYQELYGDNGNYSAGISSSSTVGTSLYYGVGGNSQNAVPGITLPYAVRYERAEIGFSYNGGKPVELIDPGSQRTMNIDLKSFMPTDQDMQFSYHSGNTAVSVSGPGYLSINAGATIVLPLELTSAPNAEGFYDVTVSVSSPDNTFSAFTITLRLYTYELEQITPSSSDISRTPSLSSDGQSAALLSKRDLASTGKSNLVYDAFLYNRTLDSYQQLTVNPAGRNCNNVVISGDASTVAILCNSSLDPTFPNTGVTDELYIYDVDSGTLSRAPYNVIADTTAGRLSINYDGQVIAFVSSINPLGSNTDGSKEVFAYHRGREKLIQLTDFNINGIDSVDLDYNGERFVVSANGNPLGANATNRYQVFTGTINNGIQRQITIATARDSKQVTISADGEKVAFSSNASLLGTNNRYNIFVASFRGEVEKQITDSALFDSVLPSLSGDASRVAFVSSASLDDRGLSNNSNNQEAYVYDLKRERGYQVSEVNESRNVEDLTLADNGNALLFSGTADWDTGSNPSRTRQMFIIEGFGDNSVSGYEEEMTPWPVVKSDNGEFAEKFISNGGHTSLLWIAGLALLGLRRRRNK